MAQKERARVIVLNYNGKPLLEECLPSIVTAASLSKYHCAVTVLDNVSQDESEAWVKEHFSQVDFVKSRANRVYCSFNGYLEEISESYVILLNNDIRVDPNFVDPLIECLKRDPLCFLVASQSRKMTGEYEGSLSKMDFKYGLLWGSTYFPGHESKIDKIGRTMQAGFGAFRREMVLDLGGFDELYLPGTVEDSDLCFRAYRRGWHAIYCPQSLIFHYGQKSFKKTFGESRLKRINRRNLYLFIWKNIRDPYYLGLHLLFIPVHLGKYLLWGEFDFFIGFLTALKRFPKAISRRWMTRAEPSNVSDQRIFQLSRAI